MTSASPHAMMCAFERTVTIALAAGCLIASGCAPRADKSGSAEMTDTAFAPIAAAPLRVNLAAVRQLADSTWLVPSRVAVGQLTDNMVFSVDCRGQTIGIVSGTPGDAVAGRAALTLGGPLQRFDAFGPGLWEAVCERLRRS